MEFNAPVALHASLAACLVLCGCDRVFGLQTYGPPGADASLPPDAAPAPGGLVAYYPMDGVDEAIDCMVDDTGRGHTGSCLDGVPTAVPGVRGMAFQLDGVVQIHVRDDPDLDPAQLTIAFWFQLVDGTTSGCAVNRVQGDAGDSWQLCVFPPQLFYLLGSGLNTFGPIVPVGEWHHVAMTYDGTTATAYLDAVGQAAMPSAVAYDGQDLVVGMDLDSGVPSAPYNGMLDELRIYDRALSPIELAALVAAM